MPDENTKSKLHENEDMIFGDIARKGLRNYTHHEIASFHIKMIAVMFAAVIAALCMSIPLGAIEGKTGCQFPNFKCVHDYYKSHR